MPNCPVFRCPRKISTSACTPFSRFASIFHFQVFVRINLSKRGEGNATMASTIHSDLLFKLRSPKIPLATKLELASTAHSHHSQPILNQVIRDYILELFLRAKQSSNSISEELIILDGNWWELLAKVVGDAFGVTTTTTLPIFIYFLSFYPTLAPSAKLLTDFGSSFDKLLSGGIRKATVDAALEGHASVLKASVIILQRGGGDTEQWQSILETWLKSFGTVLDTGKGGKKVKSALLSVYARQTHALLFFDVHVDSLPYVVDLAISPPSNINFITIE
jgi:hypothetical protein